MGMALPINMNNEILGKSPLLREILHRLPELAESDAPIVVQGQSGTGKELLALRLHALSRRSSEPMVALNCGALSPTLLDTELKA